MDLDRDHSLVPLALAIPVAFPIEESTKDGKGQAYAGGTRGAWDGVWCVVCGVWCVVCGVDVR